MSFSYPPVSFYFKVQVDGAPAVAADMAFMEVSGISVESALAEDAGQGETAGASIRSQPKYKNLILKRALVDKISPLTTWCYDTINFDEKRSDTKNILVSLLNEKGDIRMGWYFVNACPVRWSVSDLNSMENSIVVETFEFCYDYFKIVYP